MTFPEDVISKIVHQYREVENLFQNKRLFIVKKKIDRIVSRNFLIGF
jgi:hypothetical protein